MKLIPVLLVFTSILCALGQEDLTNYEDRALSFDSTTGDWGYRSLKVGRWNLGLWSGAWFQSVEADGNTRQPMANGDYAWGAVYTNTGMYPFSYHSYYSASFQGDRNLPNPDDTDWTSFNVSVSSSFLASTYLRIQEKDPNGNVVSSVSLGPGAIGNALFVWVYNDTASSILTNPKVGLYAFVVDGKQALLPPPSQPGLRVQLQFILTETAGTVNILGGLPVYPKSVETIVVISGWNYASQQNSLSLFIAVGTGSTEWSVDGQLKTGLGDDKVYFRLSKEAFINGVKSPVQIGGVVSADISATFQNPNVQVQLVSRYKKSAECKIVEVCFTPGAERIVYDPTMGSGDSPFDAPQNDSALIIGLSIGGCMLLLVIAGVIIVTWYRRRYATYAVL